MKSELGCCAERNRLDENGKRVVARLEHRQFDEVNAITTHDHSTRRFHCEISALTSIIVLVVVGGTLYTFVDVEVRSALVWN